MNGKIIGIIGSMKEVTANQLSNVQRKLNIIVVKLNPEKLIKNFKEVFKTCLKSAKKDIVIYLNTNKDSIDFLLRLVKRYGSKKAGELVSLKLGRITKYFVEKLKYNKLVLSGGTTAVGVCRILEISNLELIKKLFIGIPLTFSYEKKLYIVTKPGGFGSKTALISIFKTLRRL